ncbi:MAG: radical SAM family heme chaperone HemW [Holophagaceae bacterium]
MDTQTFFQLYGAEIISSLEDQPLGVYLHIPFCKDRCTYCSFVRTHEEGDRNPFIHTLIREIEQWGQRLNRPQLDSIYWGGGTPSVLSESEIEIIVKAIHDSFKPTVNVEHTLEANPGDLSLAWLMSIQKLGFNRISWGIQTLHDDLLKSLGRIHSSKEALTALDWSHKAGFDHVSGDLILGLPNQSPESVYSDALKMIDGGIDHLSVYLLDLEKACALKTEVDAGRVILPDEHGVASLYETLQFRLPQQGFIAYEISNYAKAGAQSRHNLKYWKRQPYLGLGPSAASHIGSYRWTSDLSIPVWTQGMGQLSIQKLDPIDEWMEIPLLGLRLGEGINWDTFSKQALTLNVDPLLQAWTHRMKDFEHAGLVMFQDSHVQLTTKGRLLSNEIFRLFV